MCIRACPGEASKENPSNKANPEYRRGTQRNTSSEREQSAHSSCNGNPLVDERTGAGYADVLLVGLWNRHGLKRDCIHKT
jgi:hypothetical protein